MRRCFSSLAYGARGNAAPSDLMDSAETELWMSVPISETLALQKPLLDGTLSIVRSGSRRMPRRFK